MSSICSYFTSSPRECLHIMPKFAAARHYMVASKQQLLRWSDEIDEFPPSGAILKKVSPVKHHFPT